MDIEHHTIGPEGTYVRLLAGTINLAKDHFESGLIVWSGPWTLLAKTYEHTSASSYRVMAFSLIPGRMVTLERTILVLKPWVNGGILDDIRANWEDITYDHVYPEHAYQWPRIGADTYHIVSPPDGESAHVSTDGSHYVPYSPSIPAERSCPL